MKQKFLSILPLLLFAAMIVNAQEPTTYRGAFAPAPVKQWTDNWTNWDPQNTFYAAPTVTVTGVITTNTTWTRNNVYLLQGIIFVDSLVTLTIEAGTVIRGDKATQISSLVIERGATIIANGTECNPIVFTSSEAIGARNAGDWGGLTILGAGLTNQGVDVPIEGIGNTNVRGRFGGLNNAASSGSLKYVRIEYAGFAIAPGNELNSLTFGGVGSGTTVDYVQTSFGNDDAFEWFGGAVNAKHLVAYRTLDDDFDTDFGYSGLVQFGLGIKDPAVSDQPLTIGGVAGSTSEGFESDNNGTAPFTPTPKTSASFYNITQIGAFRCANNSGGISDPTAPNGGFRRGSRQRRNTELKIFNSILMNNWRGLVMEADVLANGFAAFKNNIIAMDTSYTSAVVGATGKALFAENAATATYLTAAANTNTLINNPCNVLVNAWNFLNPDYRPNSVSGGALSGTDLTPGINLEFSSFSDLTTKELVVDIFENGVGNSNGTITVTIAIPSAFTVAVPGLTLNGTPQSGSNGTSANLGIPYTNGDWLFRIVGSNLIATSKPGVEINLGGSASLGYTIKRNVGVAPGTNQNLGIGVSNLSDIDVNNNGSIAALIAL